MEKLEKYVSKNRSISVRQEKMIHYYQHEKIDMQKWDVCIEQSTTLVYPLSWYLNSVFPEWNAFIIEKNGIYEAVFPICTLKKKGISYIFQPFFTQQLGYFSLQPSSAELTLFLEKIAQQFWQVISNLSIENTTFLGDKNAFFQLQKNTNCLLNLQKPYSEIYAGYNQNRKRDIKKALKNELIFAYSNNINLLIATFQQFKGSQLDELKPFHYKNIEKIYNEGSKRNQAQLFVVKNQEGEIQAIALFLFSREEIIFLLGSSTDEGKKNGAMTFLLDNVIQQFCEKITKFDFEGSNIPSIADYYLSFGAKSHIYLTIQDKKLSFLLDKFQKIKKQLNLYK